MLEEPWRQEVADPSSNRVGARACRNLPVAKEELRRQALEEVRAADPTRLVAVGDLVVDPIRLVAVADLEVEPIRLVAVAELVVVRPRLAAAQEPLEASAMPSAQAE